MAIAASSAHGHQIVAGVAPGVGAPPDAASYVGVPADVGLHQAQEQQAAPWVMGPTCQVLGGPIRGARVPPWWWCMHPLPAISGLRLGQMAVCSHPGAAGGVCDTPCSCGHNGWHPPSSGWLVAPVAPNGVLHVALPLLGATNGVHQGQMAVCGHCGAA